MVDLLYNVIIFPITQIIDFGFGFSQKIFRETWISLIFISLVISVLCLPLYNVAEKWQEVERNIQKKLKPKLDKIRAAFSGDERYMITSAYYRQNHYHPVYALRSSFGLLIQIPFFIAAYAYLSHLEVFKGAHFFLIHDLSKPDALIHLGNITLNSLPIVMTLLNLASGVVYSKGLLLKDKLQLAFIALVFLVLLYNSPAALVIYWTMNNLFSLVKNFYYKIGYKHKRLILYAAFSALCLFFIYYILLIHKGDTKQRIILADMAGFAALLPWALFLITKIKKLHFKYDFHSKYTFPVFLTSFLVLFLLVGFYMPSILIAASPQEFSYIDNNTTPLFFIFNTFSQSLGFFILWPLAIYFLFSEKTKFILACAGFILCTGAILNTFVFPGSYGLISINMEFSDFVRHTSAMLRYNMLFLGLSALLCLALMFLRFQKIIIPVLSICSAALLCISVVNSITINKGFVSFSNARTELSKEKTSVEPFFTLSKNGKNTVIIMLDRATSSFFPYILEESPDLKERYSGFTYYPNTLSFNGYTRIGAPPLFGGYEYTPQEINKRDHVQLRVKHNEALLMLPRIFSEAGYSVTVTDPPYPNFSKNEDLSIYDGYPKIKALLTDGIYTNLWIEEHDLHFPLTSDILKRNIFWYGLFRVSPMAIRDGLYQYGDWCSSVSGKRLRLFINGYSVLDYMPRLTEITNNEENTMLFMVNNTTHEAAFLQEPDYRPVLNVSHFYNGPYNKETEYHINIAAYKRLADWFDFLKANGVYDNTRIILVSDHGSQSNYVTRPFPTMPSNIDNFNPILLVKDFSASGELKTDMTFMTNADTPFLALQGQIEDTVNPFTGNAISTVNKEKPLYIAISGSVHLEDPNQTQISLNPQYDYYVHGGFFEEHNWSKAEK